MTNELREAAQRALTVAKGKIESALDCHPQAVKHLLGEAWDLINEAAGSLATTPEAAAQAEGCEPQGDPKSALQWAAARSMAVTKEWARGWDDCRAALATQPVQAQGTLSRIEDAYREGFKDAATFKNVDTAWKLSVSTHLTAPAVDRGLSEGLGLLIPHLRNGEWNLRTPQELADIIADKLESALAASAPSQAEPDVGAMEYRGNTVSYIYAKKDAYAQALDSAWQVLREFGHNSDGSTPLNDMIRKALVAPSQAGSCQASGAACDHCGGTGELFMHAEDCADELCALNGDEHSCHGRVEPCVCRDTAPPAGRTLTADEISEIAERVGAIEPTDSFWQEFARAILAASSTTAGERE